MNIPTVLDRASMPIGPFLLGDAEEREPASHPFAFASHKSSLREQIVLLFHGIGEPPSHVAADERPFWIGEALFRDIVNMACNEDFSREIVFTFDDGNRSDLRAAELLEKAGLIGHFFLLSGRLDAPNFLRRSEVRDLARAGMGIGLHGHSHVKWQRLGPRAWHEEIHNARSQIEQAAQHAVDSVALPYGWYDRNVLRRLQADGFEQIYTADRGPTPASSMIIRRTAITHACSLRDVRDIIDDKVRPLSRVRRKIAPWVKRWR